MTFRYFVTIHVVALIVASSGGCFRRSKPTIIPGSLSAQDSHDLMVTTLAEIAADVADDNHFVGDRLARTIRDELQQMPQTAPTLQRWLKTYQLAKAELHLGNETKSLELMNESLGLIRDDLSQVRPDLLNQFYFDTAVAYLRWAETQNCCKQNTPESCIVPIQAAAVHQDREGSERAIQWLQLLLKQTAADEPMQLAARWLMNLAYMTLGEYPAGVPTEYLISGIDRPSDVSLTPWRNVAQKIGLASFSLAGGAIAEDFDNDGDIDLVVSSWDPREPLKLFWNDGQNRFRDGAARANLHKILGGLNMTQTDFNNDGFIDIFVLRGGWLGAAGRHPNSLLRNNGDGTFTDVTITAGLALPQLPTQTAAWADYDLDGDLDVYIGNESSVDFSAPSQLFRNNGDETFTDVTNSARVSNDLLAKAVAWGDFDNDRYPDIYVSNYRGDNRLYHNQGDGTFRDLAGTLGVKGPEASFPTWFCDANQDGDLDLFVAAYSGGIAEVASHLLGRPIDKALTLPRLYLGDSGGTFTDQAEAMGLVDPTHPMGANFGDLDNDGFCDFYLGTGWPEYHELMPNMLYMNREGKTFVDATNAARVGHLQKGHAVAMADFDNDGDLDIFEQMGGFVPGDKFYDVLFENPGNEYGWIKIKLLGKTSNRIGLGARIELHVKHAQRSRTIYRTVNTGGSFGANPLEQHIGVGDAERIETLRVFWPATGQSDEFRDIQVNQRLIVTEGASQLQIVETR